jgi:hypothetical protein
MQGSTVKAFMSISWLLQRIATIGFKQMINNIVIFHWQETREATTLRK